MHVYQVILYLFFAVWFLATAITQFKEKKLAQKIKSLDYFGMIPLWTFFAPNPGVNDYHLLFREEDGEKRHSEWKEIEINENRKISTCIWNPSKRGKKVLSDVIQNIIPLIGKYKDKPQTIIFSLPYMLILGAVMREQCLLDSSGSKQFVLTATNGYGSNADPSLILLSEFHPISSNP